MVATTRQNPAPSRTQPLDLIHPPRQIDSPIRPQNAQVGLKQRVAGGDLFDLKNDSAETIAGTIITKAGIDKAAKIARAILNSPQRDEREQAEREFADGGEELTERTVKLAQREAVTKKPKAG